MNGISPRKYFMLLTRCMSSDILSP